MKVVGYVRLSRDDGNDESISVANQKLIINQYAKLHNLYIEEFYVDDGYSGYTFDRPSFNRLKKDIQDGKIDIVITKDLSRLGRHNAKTLLFIEEITLLNKQIIVINDDFNNLKDDDDMIGIKTWFNERHVKDTSKKVRNAINALQNEGQWISNIPYGYKRIYGKKKAFEVDPLTAPYVKKIFELYTGGMGGHSIAKQFSIEGIPTPTMAQNIHRKEAGLDPIKNEAKTWSSIIVRRILNNEFYIGTLVQKKTKTVGINGKKVLLDKDKHVKFHNHHEALIDVETFNLAQQLMKERDTNKYRGERVYHNIFSGIMFCGDCGKTMTPINGVQKDATCVCRTYHTLGSTFCNYNKVYVKDVIEIIKVYLKQCREALADNINKIDETIKKELQQVKGINSVEALSILEKELKDNNEELKALISQKTKEVIKNPSMSEIIEQTYQEMINDKMNRIKSLQSQIEEQKNINSNTKDIQKNLNTALAIFDEIIASDTITKKQVSTIIEKIEIYYNKGIVIKMRGNLNDVIEPRIEVTLDKEQNYTKAIIDRMLEVQEFYLMDVHKHLREHGYNYGYYRTFKPIADKMKYLNIIGASGRKTKVIADKDTAYSLLKIYTDTYTDPCVITKRANIEQLIRMSKWIEDITGRSHALRMIL